MDELPVRWEWRVFGERFAAAEDCLGNLEPIAVEESEELYLLSSRSSQNAKVRGGRMEIKLLEQVSAERLEQWRTDMQEEFPLAVEQVQKVFAALGVTPPALQPSDYEMARMINELVQPRPSLKALPVHKRRQLYRLGGCRCELTDVSAHRKRLHTVAVEAAEPARVIKTIRALDLYSYPNTSYPRGLKPLAGLPG